MIERSIDCIILLIGMCIVVILIILIDSKMKIDEKNKKECEELCSNDYRYESRSALPGSLDKCYCCEDEKWIVKKIWE